MKTFPIPDLLIEGSLLDQVTLIGFPFNGE